MVRTSVRLLVNQLHRRIPNVSRYSQRIPSPTIINGAVGTTSYLPHRNLHQSQPEAQTSSSHALASSIVSAATGTDATDADSQDEPMNEFLSRFVWKMRKKIRETYPSIDVGTCDGMLLVIAQKVLSKMKRGGDGGELLLGLSGSAVALAEDPTVDLSPHLWTTAWDLSGAVLDDMRKNRKRELMKRFLHSEDVKGMCHFASEVGIRGNMLKEFRFKWAVEEMDEWETQQGLRHVADEVCLKNEGDGITSLPERKGNIKYKIYGLDMSGSKWSLLADKVEAAQKLFPLEETKPIMGQCRILTEKIVNMDDGDDLSSLLAEWADLMKPKRADWVLLLQRIEHYNRRFHLQVAELLLNEESYEANVRDYSKLMDAYVKADQIDDAKRIFEKMSEKEIKPDTLTSIILVQMYSKAGDVDHARKEFDNLRNHGLEPDYKLYKSMIKVYLQAGHTKLGEQLMFEMESTDIKPPKEIYIELLKSYSQQGKADEAHRMVNRMQFAGIQQTLESTTLLIEAYGKAGMADQARNSYDYMIKTGITPDDRCVAGVLTAYAKKNLLDKALDFLLNLEKDGFKLGISTLTVLVDWFGRLGLVDEVERIVEKIQEKGDLPFNVHVSLCAMYAKAGSEDEAHKSLRILLAKKELLSSVDFERIIDSLLACRLLQDAKKVHELMKQSGFDSSEHIKVALMASDTLPLQRPRTLK